VERSDLTVREVAALLKIHPETVRVWLREGIFPGAYQLPRRSGWRVPWSDVEALTLKKEVA
jgi:excisionase family DNA binding protein